MNLTGQQTQGTTAFSFNTANENPDAGFSAKPPGWYDVIIAKAEKLPTKDGSGERIAVQFKIMTGQYAGQLFFNNFNIKNASEKAQQIGRSQFAGMLLKAGFPSIQDLRQIINAPLKINVGLDKTDPNRNVVTAYKAVNEVVAGQNAVSGAPTMPASPSNALQAQPMANPAQQPWGQPSAMPQAQPQQQATNPAQGQTAPWANNSPSQAAQPQQQTQQVQEQPLPPEAQAAQQSTPPWMKQ